MSQVVVRWEAGMDMMVSQIGGSIRREEPLDVRWERKLDELIQPVSDGHVAKGLAIDVLEIGRHLRLDVLVIVANELSKRLLHVVRDRAGGGRVNNLHGAGTALPVLHGGVDQHRMPAVNHKRSNLRLNNAAFGVNDVTAAGND